MVLELNKNRIITRRVLTTNITAYSIVHALIDGSCSALIAANIAVGKADLKEISFYVVLYNVIAFAFQAPLGFIADRIRSSAETAALGCLLVLVGVITYRTAAFAFLIAGLGNALFHIGGGIVSLSLRPGKATLPGIYVSTGAIGLLFGALVGESQYFSIWWIAVLLICAAIILLIIERPSMDYSVKREKSFDKFNIILICILASIAIRGLVGFMLNYSWKTNLYLLAAFTIAVACGKALGGILGDYFGWTRTALFGLLLSAPLLLLGINVPLLAILGVFLFNLTMPVTLTVIAEILPDNPGFAFGLTTLALIIGAFPAFTELSYILCRENGVLIFGAVVIMLLLMGIGLKTFFSEDSTTVKTLNRGKKYDI